MQHRRVGLVDDMDITEENVLHGSFLYVICFYIFKKNPLSLGDMLYIK